MECRADGDWRCRLGRADDALLFLEPDGVFGRLRVLAGLHFDEDEDVAVPGDDVDFAGL